MHTRTHTHTHIEIMCSNSLFPPPTATSHNSQNTNIEVPKIIPNLLKHLHPPPPMDSKSLARPGLNSTTCNPANPSTRPPVCPPAPPPPPPPPTSTRQTTHTPHQSLSQPPSQADIQALLPNSSVSGAKPPPSAELTQPVPLDVLVKHQILQAGPQNLVCMILVRAIVCEYIQSLHPVPPFTITSSSPPHPSLHHHLHPIPPSTIISTPSFPPSSPHLTSMNPLFSLPPSPSPFLTSSPPSHPP